MLDSIQQTNVPHCAKIWHPSTVAPIKQATLETEFHNLYHSLYSPLSTVYENTAHTLPSIPQNGIMEHKKLSMSDS